MLIVNFCFIKISSDYLKKTKTKKQKTKNTAASDLVHHSAKLSPVFLSLFAVLVPLWALFVTVSSQALTLHARLSASRLNPTESTALQGSKCNMHASSVRTGVLVTDGSFEHLHDMFLLRHHALEIPFSIK